MIVKFLPK